MILGISLIFSRGGFICIGKERFEYSNVDIVLIVFKTVLRKNYMFNERPRFNSIKRNPKQGQFMTRIN